MANWQSDMNKAKNMKFKQSSKTTNWEKKFNTAYNNKPGEFKSDYTNELSGIYDQIKNRKDFSYDLGSDVMYQQMKDQYTAVGKQAMQDTMGQAADLTGGFGSSYATAAGQQTYNSYLQDLNNSIPDLYNMALNKYNSDTNNLNNKLSAAQQLYNNAYNLWTANMNNYYNNVQLAQDAYQMYYNHDYTSFADDVNRLQNAASMEFQNYWNNKNYAIDLENLNLSKRAQALSEQQYANPSSVNGPDVYGAIKAVINGSKGITAPNQTSEQIVALSNAVKKAAKKVKKKK